MKMVHSSFRILGRILGKENLNILCKSQFCKCNLDDYKWESDNSPKISGGSHDPQSVTGLIDWALD